MSTAARTPLPAPKRVTSLIAAGLMALSLMIGVAATTVSAEKSRTPQPGVECTYYTRTQTKATFGFDPGAGGYWDCNFEDLDAPRLIGSDRALQR